MAGNSRYFMAVATRWRRNLVAIMWQFSGEFRHDGMGKFAAVTKKFLTFLWLNSCNSRNLMQLLLWNKIRILQRRR